MTPAVSDRILTLDVVRGVAVMGILLLNIIGFAMPPPAYFNPSAFGGATGADLAIWLGNFILFDGKMRGLFSFLFGASILLVAARAEAKGASAALVHYSRMTWLLVFGLLHLWLIWGGDILHSYALIGMIAFLFRRATVGSLVIGGVMLLFVQFAMWGMIHLSVISAERARDGAQMLTGFEQMFGRPTPAWIADQIALHRSGWWDITRARFTERQAMPIAGLLQNGWETLAYMLFGMAALKSGMLTGAWPRRRYERWMFTGFGIGIPCYALLAWHMVASDFDMLAVSLAALPASVPIRPLMVLGWASLIILMMRPREMLTVRIAAAGRMAFTNYLMTSMICTSIFYGYGLGWYGGVSRAECYLLVAVIWAGMLLWSKPWLERFAHGPLEWLWRRLAQPAPMVGR